MTAVLSDVSCVVAAPGGLARAAIICAGAVLLVAGRTTFVDGRAVSIVDDPFRVGDLPAANGPSGPRQNAPKPTGTVNNSDDGDIDKLALPGLNDIETFWKQAYREPLKGTFSPVETFYSYNSQRSAEPAGLRLADLQALQRLLHLSLRRFVCLGSRWPHAGRSALFR
jgi:predicted metalloprotease